MRSMNRGASLAALADVDTLPRAAGVSTARFAGFDADGRFQIAPGETGEPVVAVSTIGLAQADVGAKVAVAYEGGDAERPIIIGRVHERAVAAAPGLNVDGERIVIQANREIELRCGEASIILTRAGKVLIRGSYVLSRSRGANKIKGAYVDIN